MDISFLIVKKKAPGIDYGLSGVERSVCELVHLREEIFVVFDVHVTSRVYADVRLAVVGVPHAGRHGGPGRPARD